MESANISVDECVDQLLAHSKIMLSVVANPKMQDLHKIERCLDYLGKSFNILDQHSGQLNSKKTKKDLELVCARHLELEPVIYSLVYDNIDKVQNKWSVLRVLVEFNVVLFLICSEFEVEVSVEADERLRTLIKGLMTTRSVSISNRVVGRVYEKVLEQDKMKYDEGVVNLKAYGLPLLYLYTRKFSHIPTYIKLAADMQANLMRWEKGNKFLSGEIRRMRYNLLTETLAGFVVLLSKSRKNDRRVGYLASEIYDFTLQIFSDVSVGSHVKMTEFVDEILMKVTYALDSFSESELVGFLYAMSHVFGQYNFVCLRLLSYLDQNKAIVERYGDRVVFEGGLKSSKREVGLFVERLELLSKRHEQGFWGGVVRNRSLKKIDRRFLSL